MKSRIQEIAGELIKIAAERQLHEAPRLTVPTGAYDEFCAGFPYEETDDQLAAIERVIDDLGAGQADGPADLRRRRLRQDRGGAARGLRHGAQRQAGGGDRADHAAGAPALQDLHRALPRLSGERGAGLAAGVDGAAGRDQGGARRRPGRYRHRHARAARPRHQVQGPGAAGRRRGAAFRRLAQGEAEDAARRSARADADRDADPAHLATGAHRRARSLDHRLAAGRPAGGAHVRLALRCADRARGAAAREIPRRPGLLCLPAHRGPRRRQGLPRQTRAGDAGLRRARADAAGGARRHHVGLLRRQIRRAAVDHHHRIRPRHPDRQYAHRPPRRPLRPVAALSVARPGGALEAARLCAVHAAGQPLDHAAGGAAAEGAAIARHARRRLPDRLARPRHPRRRQPARARSSPATSRRSASSSTSRCWKRRC